MKTFLLIQFSYLLPIFGAAICGGLIGYERENHFKMAGIRTHMVVCMTAALMMIISKYGFFDVLTSGNISLDPSRIAAGVVTAIGFLGASVIFTRKMHVSGLTTAAGIWAVVGIGMAFGSGMYIVGIAVTIFILFMQYIFHCNFKFTRSPTIEQITLRVDPNKNINTILDNAFTSKKIVISNIKVTRIDASILEVKLFVCYPDIYKIDDILALVKDTPEIVSIDI